MPITSTRPFLPLLAATGLVLPVSALAYDLSLGLGYDQTYVTSWVREPDGKNGTEVFAVQSDLSAWWPTLSLSTDKKMFGDSHFGYRYYGWYSRGEAGKLKSDGRTSLPDPIETSILYAGAALFLNLAKNDASHTLGIGLGVGRITARGDVPAAYTLTKTDEHVDVASTGVSVNLFYTFVYQDWFLNIEGQGVSGKNNTETRNYSTTVVSVSLGRVFHFDKMPWE